MCIPATKAPMHLFRAGCPGVWCERYQGYSQGCLVRNIKCAGVHDQMTQLQGCFVRNTKCAGVHDQMIKV